MNHWVRNFLLLALMLAASAGAFALRPTHKIADLGPKVDLEAMIPHAFGEWQLESAQEALVINPQQAETLEMFYSQSVSRTYKKAGGYRVMLSIAYGEDQSRTTQLHKPETCYSAQGFGLKFSRPALLQTRFGALETTQLFAYQGARMEPITYWMRVEDVVLRGGVSQTLLRFKLGLFKGVIPDGLLFRVSDISSEPEPSFDAQAEFVRDFLDASSPELRTMLIGKKSVVN